MITSCINREIHPPLWVCCGIGERTDIYCSVAKSCLTLCDPMDCSTPGFPVLHYLPEFAQTHVHWVDDAIQPSHLCHPLLPLPSIFPSTRFFSNGSSHQVAKVLELQLQNQSFQWIFGIDFLEDWLIWSPCCRRNSQWESSPAPQFKSINSSALSLLYGSTLTSVQYSDSIFFSPPQCSIT